MQNHTKIYFSFFGYDISSFVPCEICGSRGTEIYHIHRRGRRNEWNADIIENLQAICRCCHSDLGDKKKHKATLYELHLKKLKETKKYFNVMWILAQIEKY